MSRSDQPQSAPFESLADAYRFLDGHINYERNLDQVSYTKRTFEIESFAEWLASLGNPHRQIRAIHIAGTRGKGSSALMLEAILLGSGLKVATYSSPHLREYRERIRIGGQPVSAEGFCRAMGRARSAAGESQNSDPSFKTVFEYLTAAFFLAAEEAEVDWMVVETGLGGRLDATNVLPPGPVLLTRIGLDHTHLLGGTITEIAAEKAAILKPGGWGVVSRQGPGGDADRVFSRRAEETGADLHRASQIGPLTDASYTPNGMTLAYRFEERELKLSLPWFGPFLSENLEGALAMVGELRQRGLIPPLPDQALVETLRKAHFPGRMQPIGPWGDDGPTFFVDSGHCPTAAAAIAEAMARHFGPDAEATALVAMMKDKDQEGFFRALAEWPGWGRIVCYTGSIPRSEQAEDLARRARLYFDSVQAFPCLDLALQFVSDSAEESGRTVAAGSIYSIVNITDRLLGHGRKADENQPERAAEAQPSPDSGNPGTQPQPL